MIVVLKKEAKIFCVYGPFQMNLCFNGYLQESHKKGEENIHQKIFFNTVRLTPSLPHLFD